MVTDDLLVDWLSLRLAPEMSRARFYTLVQRFETPEKVYGASVQDICNLRGLTPEFATALLKSRGSDIARRHRDRLARAGISVITRQCADYPFGLANSSLVPPLLFVRGTLLPEDKYSIALVGSRHATTYGRSVAREMAGGLARFGLTVVSGFARGIDGEAHHAAIKAGGRTLAVLGNGLDVCYPSEHGKLGEDIAAHGALITEYPLGTPPDRFNFPERNHVIAALAMGTLVVEAAEKSGSLITARLALEENRFIFAVPGDITRNNSRGANSLIQNGARMVQRAQDVLFEMKAMLRGYLDVDRLEAEQASGSASGSTAAAGYLEEDRRARPKKDWVDEIQKLGEVELEILAAELKLDDRETENRLAMQTPAMATSGAPGSTSPPPQRPSIHEEATVIPTARSASSSTFPRKAVSRLGNLADAISETDFFNKPVEPPSRSQNPVFTAEEQFILDLLHHEAMVFDELAEAAFGRGIDVPRLTSLLMKLELKRAIKQLPGRYYVRFS